MMFDIIVVAFLFGVLTKQADLFNEHGLKEPFNGAGFLAGLSWGIAGGLLIYLNVYTGIFYTALILYWMLRLKLEYRNHAVGGVLMLLTSMGFLSESLSSRFPDLILILFAYEMSRYLQSIAKSRWLAKAISFRLYLIPLIYSWYVGDYIVFITSLSALLGVRLTNWLSYYRIRDRKGI